MSDYYNFDENGLLKPCDKSEIGDGNGTRFLNASRVAEMSDGRYNSSGWIAARVSQPLVYGGDDLGTKGIMSHADGKMYDSKYAYYKSIKDKGLEIIGNEPIKPPKPKLKEIDWKRAVAETLTITPLKGTNDVKKKRR